MKALRVVQVGVCARRVTRRIEFSSVEDQYHATSFWTMTSGSTSWPSKFRCAGLILARSLESESAEKMLIPDSTGNIRLGLSWTVHLFPAWPGHTRPYPASYLSSTTIFAHHLNLILIPILTLK